MNSQTKPSIKSSWVVTILEPMTIIVLFSLFPVVILLLANPEGGVNLFARLHPLDGVTESFIVACYFTTAVIFVIYRTIRVFIQLEEHFTDIDRA